MGQGSLSPDELARMIKAVGYQRILPAESYLDRALENRLETEDLCLTFDDGLRCQYDLALPVLTDLKLTAFWFVYTSPLEDKVERLELYRHFRTTAFPNVESFYDAFDTHLSASHDADSVERALREFDTRTYLPEFMFYTTEDRRFRYLRDRVLGQTRYFEIIDEMIATSGFCTDNLLQELWIGSGEISSLVRQGHVVGLHSHTHPTDLTSYPVERQREEYRRNYELLYRLVGRTIQSMSHPCNSYDSQTLSLLRDMGIKLGFRSNMQGVDGGLLEHPREDAANLRKLI